MQKINLSKDLMYLSGRTTTATLPCHFQRALVTVPSILPRKTTPDRFLHSLYIYCVLAVCAWHSSGARNHKRGTSLTIPKMQSREILQGQQRWTQEVQPPLIGGTQSLKRRRDATPGFWKQTHTSAHLSFPPSSPFAITLLRVSPWELKWASLRFLTTQV